jgi:hypothetical protein
LVLLVVGAGTGLLGIAGASGGLLISIPWLGARNTMPPHTLMTPFLVLRR